MEGFFERDPDPWSAINADPDKRAAGMQFPAEFERWRGGANPCGDGAWLAWASRKQLRCGGSRIWRQRLEVVEGPAMLHGAVAPAWRTRERGNRVRERESNEGEKMEARSAW